jgi:fructose-1,6-bisphosphatase I
VRIADELARAALIGQLGTTGETNVQGEKVRKLDLGANSVVVAALDGTGRACTLVPTEPHQRVPLLIGSSDDVRLAEEFYAARRA